MTKFKDFDELVKTNVGLAEEIMTADISYGMALIECQYSKIEDISHQGFSLSVLDDAYDKYIYLNKIGNKWYLYCIQMDEKTNTCGDNIVLGTVSVTYERYQISRFIADLYLTFYQNFKVY